MSGRAAGEKNGGKESVGQKEKQWLLEGREGKGREGAMTWKERKEKKWCDKYGVNAIMAPHTHTCPTNNATLINFRLSSGAEILLISTDWAYKSDVYAMCPYSDWTSILHTTVAGWVWVSQKKMKYNSSSFTNIKKGKERLEFLLGYLNDNLLHIYIIIYLLWNVTSGFSFLASFLFLKNGHFFFHGHKSSERERKSDPSYLKMPSTYTSRLNPFFLPAPRSRNALSSCSRSYYYYWDKV